MTLKKRLARTIRALSRAGRIFMGQETSPAPQSVSLSSQDSQGRYFYLGPELALTRLASGHLLYVDPLDEHVSANIIVHGVWEPAIHRVILSLLSPGAKVIEVGANVGYYTVEMAAGVGPEGSVTSLEANPRLAGLVQRSLLLNGYADRAQVIPKAALDSPAIIDFVTSRRNSGGGFVTIWNHTPYDDAVVIQVEAVRLDDLGHETVDFIRLDAEGSEPFILRGAARLLQANPNVTICLEWSVIQMGSRTSVPDFVSWLQTLGFQFWRIETDASLTSVPPSGMLTIDACDVILSRTTPEPRLI